MTEIIRNILAFLYNITILLIFLYTISQFFLVIIYLLKKRLKPEFSPDYLPYVTIQLPIYNEKYVVDRLIKNIVAIEYPSAFLQIQLLDDSTDESLASNRELVRYYAAKGIDIVHLFRKDRENYKAGALKEGLKTAKGDFIAIFDADFLPSKEWLKKSIGYFINPKVGVVQARWEHINRNFSIATLVQGMALDHHFVIEQTGRNLGNHFINFNGTAGIWRKECITDAGNWEGDTLTEDLDLSYRAQLKNWEFIYLENLGTPSELPVAMSAVRTQQYRWNKGGAENFRKNISKVIKSKELSFSTKFHAIAHLLNSSVFLWVFLFSILSVPMVVILQKPTFFDAFLNLGLFLKYNIFALILIFYITFRKTQSRKIKDIPKYLFQFLLFFPVVMGLAFHNSIAVLEGYFRRKTAFIRTPKFNIINKTDDWKSNNYLKSFKNIKVWLELPLILFFGFGVYLDLKYLDYGFLQFHLLLITGYSFVFLKTILE